MKNIKKLTLFLLVILLIIFNFYIPSSRVVEAKTLRDLKNELAEKEKELEESNDKKKLTEKEIQNKKNTISSINLEIVNIGEEKTKLTQEIETLGEEIKEKEKQIKEIINYYQLSSGESEYLEYIFAAKDFSDFIYRMAITEQLTDYNDKLIDEYNNKIKENEQKTKDLNAKKVSLNEKQKELQKELDSLGSQLGEILDENVSIEDDIKSMKKMISLYEDIYKCKLDEDINTCGASILPPDTAFYRPVVSGSVSADYGIYYPWGYAMMHYGMDIAGSGHGANVYAMASGRVAYITYKSNCGGNMIYIHHNINGTKYTTGYFHLGSVRVNVGDIVTKDTVIGTVGGNPRYETWDTCSTGTHLHIQFAYTNIPAGAGFYTKFTAKSFNPRNVLNIPAYGVWFSNRTTRY